MEKPKVSIIIPTYKDHKGLNRALRSAVNQTYKNLEVIVVNDYPEEDIDDFIEVGDDRIKTINLEENQGPGNARNVGIKRSSGKLLFFLDSDDSLHENTIEELVGKYERGGFKAVTCWGEDLRTNETMEIPKDEGDLYERSLEVCILIPPGPMIEREAIKEVGMYDGDGRLEDRKLGMRVAKNFNIGVVKKPLYLYNSKDVEDMKKRRIKRLESQEYLLEKHPEIKESKKAYSNLCQRMGLGYMLKGDIQKSREYFRKSLENKFALGTFLTYLSTFLPDFCRNFVFKTIEKNKNLLKELGY